MICYFVICMSRIHGQCKITLKSDDTTSTYCITWCAACMFRKNPMFFFQLLTIPFCHTRTLFCSSEWNQNSKFWPQELELAEYLLAASSFNLKVWRALTATLFVCQHYLAWWSCCHESTQQGSIFFFAIMYLMHASGTNKQVSYLANRSP